MSSSIPLLNKNNTPMVIVLLMSAVILAAVLCATVEQVAGAPSASVTTTSAFPGNLASAQQIQSAVSRQFGGRQSVSFERGEVEGVFKGVQRQQILTHKTTTDFVRYAQGLGYPDQWDRDCMFSALDGFQKHKL